MNQTDQTKRSTTDRTHSLHKSSGADTSVYRSSTVKSLIWCEWQQADWLLKIRICSSWRQPAGLRLLLIYIKTLRLVKKLNWIGNNVRAGHINSIQFRLYFRHTEEQQNNKKKTLHNSSFHLKSSSNVDSISSLRVCQSHLGLFLLSISL